MKNSYHVAWIIAVTVCLCIGYLIRPRWKVRFVIETSINDHQQARINFLSNTFCGKLISNNTYHATINKRKILKRNRLLRSRIEQSEDDYKNVSCITFIVNNGFYSKYITHLEKDNPMAFSILVYKNVYQFQVLMRTIYVRSNLHCIHVDRNASTDLYSYALKLSTCLVNVHILTPRLKLSWGTMSILEAERGCQTYLLNQSSKWHYYMTIAGTELPIQTNRNRIQILQLVPDQSRNDVSSFPQRVNRQASKNSPPPGNITVYKGEFHSILTRNFIQAVHTNSLALQFRSFLNGTSVPDEQFYPTLVRLPELPGGKARGTLTYYYHELLSHYKIWLKKNCQSAQLRNSICQFNYKDLANIEQSGRLFANKFNQDLDLISINCWEQWLKIKQVHHQDIDPQNYIDKFPFTRRKPYNKNTTVHWNSTSRSDQFKRKI